MVRTDKQPFRPMNRVICHNNVRVIPKDSSGNCGFKPLLKWLMVIICATFCKRHVALEVNSELLIDGGQQHNAESCVVGLAKFPRRQGELTRFVSQILDTFQTACLLPLDPTDLFALWT